MSEQDHGQSHDDDPLAELLALRAEQVVAGTVSTLINVAYVRLGLIEDAADAADPAQARVAIDAVAALTPVLERVLPPQAVTELRSTLAGLQMEFARRHGGPAPPAPAPPRPSQRPPERPRIWTPRGDV